MRASSIGSRVVGKLGSSPLVARVHWRIERDRGETQRFFGVYTSFEKALAEVPRDKLVGYDNAELASFYRERLDRVYPADYPAMYWLNRITTTETHVFDFGGHVGLHHYGFARFLQNTPRQWTVCDVGEVVRSGRELAVERGARSLAFTEKLEDADGCDVFFASGALQYLEADQVLGRLHSMRTLPQHVIINKTPCHDSAGFVTLQDTGVSIHAYTIFQRSDVVQTLEASGYRLVDSWLNPEHGCRILFDRKRSIPAYSGFYFTRDPAS